jgi:transcriptional regulator with XRE-family HTH domain
LIRESQTFGSRLRAERERRGISLASIAEKTKIKKSFLESLERGDFSKWPAGTVFRRAYVRDYAAAIGLSPESVIVDFVRLSPVDEEEPIVAPSPLTLTFDTAPTRRSRLDARRAWAAAIDAGGLLALGGILALLTGGSVWTSVGTLAFVYYPAAYALWGRSVAARYLEARATRRQVIAISGTAPRIVAEPAAPSPQKPVAVPVQAVVSRPEAVVDPLLLTAAHRPPSSHVPQETTTH